MRSQSVDCARPLSIDVTNDPALIRNMALAARYRARGGKVILGGLHVLSCPEEYAARGGALLGGVTGADLEAHAFAALKIGNDLKQIAGIWISGWAKHPHQTLG